MFYIYNGKAYYYDGHTIFDTIIRGKTLLIKDASSDVIDMNRTATYDEVLKIFSLDAITSDVVNDAPKKRGRKPSESLTESEGL